MKKRFVFGILFVLLIFVVPYPAIAQSGKDIIKHSLVKGGIVVHIGCDTGKFTAELYGGRGFLVHGLSKGLENIKKARKYIQSQNLHRNVSVDTFDNKALPYADNIVKLVVARKDISQEIRDEIVRILEPEGVAMIRDAQGTKIRGLKTAELKTIPGWTKYIKPWPDEIDEWTHYLHGPDGNQVAEDTVVGPPKHIQWLARPFWSRAHRYHSQTAVVTVKARLFYVSNDVESSFDLLPDRPHIVARDAFSGVLLWKHPIFPRPLKERLKINDDPEKYFLYEPAFPMELKVVAAGDRLYLAFNRDGAIQVLDAATGKLLKVYKGTENTEEILYYKGKLLSVASTDKLKKMYYTPSEMNDLQMKQPRAKIVRALNAETGKILWEYNTEKDGGLQVSPVITENRVFTLIGDQFVCLDFGSGKKIWNAPAPVKKEKKGGKSKKSYKKGVLSAFYTKGPSILARLIVSKDVLLLLTTSAQINAFSTKDGKSLWSYKGTGPERSGANAFIIEDQVWVHEKQDENLFLLPLDIKTGEKGKKINLEKAFNIEHHHRCYGNRATRNFLLTGRRGVEFINFNTEEIRLHHWIRGKCRFGILPGNGLLYTLPHGCSCYPFSTLKGYTALAPQSKNKKPNLKTVAERLEKGPAYNEIRKEKLKTKNSFPWPTHRHDVQRGNTTQESIGYKGMKLTWKSSLGGKPTGLTASDKQIFTCTPESRSVHALDIENGKILWKYTVGSRVDSPPTLYNNLAIFGSADGYVYCVRADNGKLVWRFLAAQFDRRIVAYEQLESIWPVHGAVLVQNHTLYVSAGRTSLLDGGISVYALEPATGKVKAHNIISQSYLNAERAMKGNTGRNYEGEVGLLQDMLVGDGKNIYIRQLKLNTQCVPIGKSEKLISGNSLLYAAWFSRIGWYFGEPTKESRSSNKPGKQENYLKSWRQGRYLMFDDKMTYSVRINPDIGKFDRYFIPGKSGYRIFADTNNNKKNKWNIYVPIHVEAMTATAGKILFIAGSPDIVDKNDPWAALDGKKGGLVWAVSTENGKKLTELKLDSPPVFDGLIAANGKLFMSLQDGSVICCTGE